MSVLPNSAPDSKPDSAEVDEAFKAFAAIQKAMRADPELASNKYLQALHDTGYARFLMLFEAL